MPSIPQLQRFIAVAEELNFRRAAARLNISQPPLSDSIRHLETELGTSLLNRTRRRVELTKSGETFLEKARLILSLLDEAVDVTRAVAQGLSGYLAIGFNPTSSYDLLPRILRRFRADYPDVGFRFEEITTAEQEDALRQKRVDVALFLAPTVDRHGICHETVLRERLLVVLPEDHALTRRKRIDLRNLKLEPFIFLPSRWGTGYQARVLHACQEAGFAPDVILEVDRVHTLVSLVGAGMGIGLCPASLRRFQPPGAAFRELHDPKSQFYVEFGIAWRQDGTSVLVDAFVEVARGIDEKSSR